MRANISLKINKRKKIKRREKRKKKVKEEFIGEVTANILNSEKGWKVIYGTKSKEGKNGGNRKRRKTTKKYLSN